MIDDDKPFKEWLLEQPIVYGGYPITYHDSNDILDYREETRSLLTHLDPQSELEAMIIYESRIDT